MRREDIVALKIVGLFTLGGTLVAAVLLVTSLFVPVNPSALHIGIAVTVATFGVWGLVESVRYRHGAARGRRGLGKPFR